MNDIQLEKLYVVIEAQTAQFNKQMEAVNAKIADIGTTTKVSIGNTGSLFKKVGKMITGLFIGREISNFLRNLSQMSYKSEEFSATTEAALKTFAYTLTPLIEVLIVWIAKAISWVSGLIRAMFKLPPAIKKSDKSLTKFNKTLAKFDELNTIAAEEVSDNNEQTIESLIDVNKYLEEGKKFWDDYGAMITTVAAVIIGGLFLTNVFKGIDALMKFGKAISSITILGDTFATVSGGLLVKTLASLFNWFYGIGGAILNFFLPAMEVGVGIFSTLGATALGFIAIAALVVAAIWGISEAIKWGNSPATEAIDELGDGFSKATTEALTPFMDAMDDIEATLKRIDLADSIVSQADVDRVKTRMAEIGGTIRKELEDDKQAALDALDAIRQYYGGTPEEFAKLVEDTKAYYDDLIKSTQEAEDEINAILKKAKDENRTLTNEENAKLQALQQIIYDAGVVALTENAKELKAIKEELSNDLIEISKNEAREMLSQAIILKNDMKREAEETFNSVVIAADGLKEAGAITEEEYNKMVDAAKATKDAAIKAADDQYQGVADAAEKRFPMITETIDKENGKILNNLQTGLNLLGKLWSDFWKDLSNPKVKGNITIGGGIKVDDVDFGPYDWSKITGYAVGGMPTTGSLFMAGESGAELLGSYGGKTTVMPLENTSFVAAMGTAVYGAVAAALSENTGGSTTIVVDGMTLAKSVESNLNKLSLAKGGLDIAL